MEGKMARRPEYVKPVRPEAQVQKGDVIFDFAMLAERDKARDRHIKSGGRSLAHMIAQDVFHSLTPEQQWVVGKMPKGK
jgi:hypothetical protein